MINLKNCIVGVLTNQTLWHKDNVYLASLIIKFMFKYMFVNKYRILK